MRALTMCLGMIMTLSTGIAQSQPGIDGLIGTERAFAARAIDHDTRQAFLEYLDSGGVVFNDGVIQNGIQVWTAYPASTSKILWHPIFAGLASSGDIGFTTGPWEYKKTAASDTVLASGFFTTIWHLSANNGWKFLADMGTTCSNARFRDSAIKKWAPKKKTKGKTTDILSIENAFIAGYAKKGPSVYGEWLAEDAWFNLKDALPFTNRQDILSKGLTLIPAGLDFTPVHGEMSASADFGYVYGTVHYKGKQENYLRVWTVSDGQYKILLQVLNW